MTKIFCDCCECELPKYEYHQNVKIGRYIDMEIGGTIMPIEVQRTWNVIHFDVCQDCAEKLEKFITNRK